jgi:hypothetical protein
MRTPANSGEGSAAAIYQQTCLEPTTAIIAALAPKAISSKALCPALFSLHLSSPYNLALTWCCAVSSEPISATLKHLHL